MVKDHSFDFFNGLRIGLLYDFLEVEKDRLKMNPLFFLSGENYPIPGV